MFICVAQHQLQYTENKASAWILGHPQLMLQVEDPNGHLKVDGGVFLEPLSETGDVTLNVLQMFCSSFTVATTEYLASC